MVDKTLLTVFIGLNFLKTSQLLLETSQNFWDFRRPVVSSGNFCKLVCYQAGLSSTLQACVLPKLSPATNVAMAAPPLRWLSDLHNVIFFLPCIIFILSCIIFSRPWAFRVSLKFGGFLPPPPVSGHHV